MVDIKDKGCHKCIRHKEQFIFRGGDRHIKLVAVIAVIKFKQNSVERRRRLKATLDGEEGEFGRAKGC